MDDESTDAENHHYKLTDEEQDEALAQVILASKVELLARWSWRKDAACATAPPDYFILESGANAAKGKKFCDVCPVRTECFEFAVRNKCMGLWGGVMFTVNSTPSAPARPPIQLVPLVILRNGQPSHVPDESVIDLFG